MVEQNTSDDLPACCTTCRDRLCRSLDQVGSDQHGMWNGPDGLYLPAPPRRLLFMKILMTENGPAFGARAWWRNEI
jgi:hypothetical protein